MLVVLSRGLVWLAGMTSKDPFWYIRIDRNGDLRCVHEWEDLTYNDWGVPYYVATCKLCKRQLSSPTHNVYKLVQG